MPSHRRKAWCTAVGEPENTMKLRKDLLSEEELLVKRETKSAKRVRELLKREQTKHLGQTYLMFCCSSLVGQNFSVFEKKKGMWSRVWVNAHVHMALSQMACLWLSVKVVSGCTVTSGTESLTVPRRNFWQPIAKIRGGQALGEWCFFYLPATRVCFVTKLARATEH